MSVRVISWVFERSPVENSVEQLVLLVLADHADDDGARAFPSVSTIVRKSRLSKRSVQGALRRLEADGVIVRVGRSPSGTFEYRIVMTGVQDVHPRAGGAPVQDVQGGAGDDIEGCTTCTPEGAGRAPEPSVKPSKEPSSSGDAASQGELSATIEATTTVLRRRGTWDIDRAALEVTVQRCVAGGHDPVELAETALQLAEGRDEWRSSSRALQMALALASDGAGTNGRRLEHAGDLDRFDARAPGVSSMEPSED